MAQHQPPSRINLQGGAVLLLQATLPGTDVVAQILVGFGANRIHRCTTFAEACALAEEIKFELVIVDAQLEGVEDGYDFVRWLRRSGLEPNAFALVLMTVAHASESNVLRARDSGAHFIVAKPLTPALLWERILWMARDNRPFVETPGDYVGPDRRFRNLGPAPGMRGRRATDISAEVGAATAPNLSQLEVDFLLQPQRASL